MRADDAHHSARVPAMGDVQEDHDETHIPMFGGDELVRRTGLVGSSVLMQDLRRALAEHAAHRFPVLVTGESGTGKELCARALHELGGRAAGALVAVNAATIRSGLAESELFGHVRGAFTGAVVSRRGLFEQARGGTLFLDEIAELDLATQAALLRVVETGEVRMLGGERVQRFDVRLVVATHVDLREAVRAGRFRADLFHRLAVIEIRAPALRERLDDLAELVRHLLDRMPSEFRPTLAPGALQPLRAYPWPGNVRELGNVVVRTALRVGRGTAHTRDFETALRQSLTAPQDTPSRAALEAALVRAGGSVAGAARMLGVPRTTLRDHLRRAGLQRAP